MKKVNLIILPIFFFITTASCNKEEIYIDELGYTENSGDYRNPFHGTYQITCNFYPDILGPSYSDNGSGSVTFAKSTVIQLMELTSLYPYDFAMSSSSEDPDVSQIIVSEDGSFLIPQHQYSNDTYYTYEGSGSFSSYGGVNYSYTITSSSGFVDICNCSGYQISSTVN